MPGAGMIDVAGIRNLARDFGLIDKSLRAALIKEIRNSGDKLRDEIRSSDAPPYKSGRLRSSVRTSVRGGSLSLYSREPYANVQHWGGTISPKGTPIKIRKTLFVYGPATKATPRITEEMAVLLDLTAVRYGFHY
jgi:hypothetical protein